MHCNVCITITSYYDDGNDDGNVKPAELVTCGVKKSN